MVTSVRSNPDIPEGCPAQATGLRNQLVPDAALAATAPQTAPDQPEAAVQLQHHPAAGGPVLALSWRPAALMQECSPEAASREMLMTCLQRSRYAIYHWDFA